MIAAAVAARRPFKTDSAILAIHSPFLAMHVACRNHANQCAVSAECEGHMQQAVPVASAKNIATGFDTRMRPVFDHPQALVEENLFRLGHGHGVLQLALALVPAVPLEPFDTAPIGHACMPSTHTVGSVRICAMIPSVRFCEEDRPTCHHLIWATAFAGRSSSN